MSSPSSFSTVPSSPLRKMATFSNVLSMASPQQQRTTNANAVGNLRVNTNCHSSSSSSSSSCSRFAQFVATAASPHCLVSTPLSSTTSTTTPRVKLSVQSKGGKGLCSIPNL